MQTTLLIIYSWRLIQTGGLGSDKASLSLFFSPIWYNIFHSAQLYSAVDGETEQIIKNSISSQRLAFQSLSSWNVRYLLNNAGLLCCNLVEGGIF